MLYKPKYVTTFNKPAKANPYFLGVTYHNDLEIRKMYFCAEEHSVSCHNCLYTILALSGLIAYRSCQISWSQHHMTNTNFSRPTDSTQSRRLAHKFIGNDA